MVARSRVSSRPLTSAGATRSAVAAAVAPASLRKRRRLEVGFWALLMVPPRGLGEVGQGGCLKPPPPGRFRRGRPRAAPEIRFPHPLSRVSAASLGLVLDHPPRREGHWKQRIRPGKRSL